MRCRLISFLWLASIGLPSLAFAAQPRDAAAPSDLRTYWWYFDGPLWDIADEGLPFRFTVALPAARDPLTRWMRGHESRWTMSIGYARVYDSYDAATGLFKNPGSDAVLFSAGRQTVWRFPDFLGALTPQLAVEFGMHYATKRFPADGTRANLKLITGLQWTRRRPDGTEWMGGIHWPHFSNANLFSRNAGYDGLVLRFGRSVSF